MSDMFEVDREIKNTYLKMSIGKNTCPKCNSIFEVSVFNDDFPNRENELVSCPYCSSLVGYVRTSVTGRSYKIN